MAARPARVGFNLAEAVAPFPENAPYAGQAGVRRYRGRVIGEVEDGVHVLVGEIPSGVTLDAVLPRAWFEEASVLVTPQHPILLVVWPEGDADRHHLESAWVAPPPEEAPLG